MLDCGSSPPDEPNDSWETPTSVLLQILAMVRVIASLGIDWDNRNDTFHNEWQEYRTEENPKLEAESSKVYSEYVKKRNASDSLTLTHGSYL